MTHRIDESDLPDLLAEAVGPGDREIDHARLQARGRRRRGVRRATAATGSLGVLAAAAVAVPLLVPSGEAPLVGGDPAPVEEPVAGDGALDDVETVWSCPSDLASSWRCLEPAERPHAPEPELGTLDGEQLTLEGLRGQNVVVSVWGSWCGPCIDLQPELNEVHATRDDLAFIGIATQDPEPRVAEFIDTHGVTYPTLLDTRGDYARRLTGTLQAIDPDAARQVVPATYLIDRDGRIAAWHTGQHEREDLTTAIDTMLR